MANYSQRGVKPIKQYSFIDWNDLDEEEFVKLNRIINGPHQGSAVQFPFSKDADTVLEPAPIKSLSELDIDKTPVFQPRVPPPPIVGYPVPVHWPPGSASIANPNGGHYPISVHSGYVFPNAALTANGEGTVAFVPAISNGHPMYAIPNVAHQIPAHFQGAPIPRDENLQVTVPLTAHGNEALMTHAGHTVLPRHAMPAVPQHIVHTESNAVPLDLSQQGMPVTLTHQGMHVTVSQSVHHGIPVTFTQPGEPVIPITYAQPGMPMATHAPVVYIPHTTAEAEAVMDLPTEIKQSPLPSPQPPAVTGLPKKVQSSALEFGGPVMFEPKCKPSEATSEPNNNKPYRPEDSNTVNQEVVIDIENDLPVQKSDDITNDTSLITELNDSAPPALGIDPQNALVDNGNCADSSSNAVNTEIIPSLQSPNTSDFPRPSFPSITPAPMSPTPPQPAVKTWSSLFANKTPSVKSDSIRSTNSVVTQPFSNAVIDSEAFPAIGEPQSDNNVSSKEEKPQFVPLERVTAVGVHNDPLAYRLQDQINDLAIIHSPIVIQPRGLKNGQNTCFLNAPLQVLMGCPPFIHMFRSFKHLPTRSGNRSSTPILDSLVQFVNSFQNGQRMKNPGSRNKKGGQSDLTVGQPFIPEPLLNVAQNILGLHIGVQHDAEEFLSQILSICNEEMENILTMRDDNGSKVKNENMAVNGESRNQENHVEVEGNDEEDDDWQQVGPKNHHVETKVNDCGQTPLSSIFAGLSRSCLFKESGKTSDTLDSFFTLKLDIQDVSCVKDALLRLNTTETVHDADGRKVHGQRRMYFDVLPPVLIMHLKLFEYSNGNGQKIQKKVTFDVDLQIPKEIISRVGKSKYASPKSRGYKLFGVVNHHGRHMNDGHYTSDVFLPVASGWLRFDDSDISTIQEADVLYYSERSMPYLLFYRRMDVT